MYRLNWLCKHMKKVRSSQGQAAILVLNCVKHSFSLWVSLKNFGKVLKIKFILRDDTHITSMKIVQFSRLHAPIIHIRPKFFHPLDLRRPISNKLPSPLQVITNQFKENIVQEWLLYVMKTWRSPSVFSINSLILPAFPFLCLAFLLTSFHRACKRTKSKQKQNQARHIQIDHAFYCSIKPTNNAMISLRDGFIIWFQSQMEDFLSIIH